MMLRQWTLYYGCGVDISRMARLGNQRWTIRVRVGAVSRGMKGDGPSSSTNNICLSLSSFTIWHFNTLCIFPGQYVGIVCARRPEMQL